MFPLVIMYILLVPCAVLFIFTKYKYGSDSLQATVFKGLSTFVIIGAALVMPLIDGNKASVFSVLITGGLVMGLAGDVALSFEKYGFMQGMLFFGFGHLCYIAALAYVSKLPWLAAPVFVVVYGVAIVVLIKSGIKLGDLCAPVLVYSAVITAMLSFAATIPFSIFPKGLVIIAAALFFTVSDALLARNKFDVNLDTMCASVNLTKTERGVVSLSCYFLGQSLFAAGMYLL